MSELLSMLVPLETLPGWPAAPNPPVLTSIGLLIGFPVLAAVIIFGIGQLSALAKRGRGDTATPHEPAWAGDRPAGLNQGQGRAELPALDSSETPSTSSSARSEQTGGVGGRW